MAKTFHFNKYMADIITTSFPYAWLAWLVFV